MQYRSVYRAALFAAAACAFTMRASAQPMFLDDPAHTGVSTAPVPSVTAHPLWRYFTDRLNRSTPIYADGTVFVGSNNGNLYALDAETGRPRWIFHAHEPVSSTPAVRSGVVYFTDNRALYAVNERNGQARWRHEFGADVPHPGHQWDFLESSPLLWNGMLFVGSGDGNVYAFDASSGKQRWRVATGGRVRSTPAVAVETLYVGSFDGRLYALDARTGSQKWTFKTAGNPDFPLGEVQSSPAVGNGIVYFGSRDGHLYAVDAQTGTQRWNIDEHESWVISSPAIENGVVYYGVSDGNAVRAVDALTGKQIWTYDAGTRVWSSPTLAGDRLYTGTGGGSVVWLDTRTGKMLGFADSEGTIYSSVGLGGGSAFYTSDDGYIYAVR